MPKTALFFILISGLFASTHAFALATSLYWYYPWFDIAMHFWGGTLVVLGVNSASKIRPNYVRPNKRTVLSVALLLIVGWEIFERLNGLFVADVYLFDTAKDIVVGLLGVIIGYKVLKQK